MAARPKANANSGGGAAAPDDKPDDAAFIEHQVGLRAFRNACAELGAAGIPERDDDGGVSLASFTSAARTIRVAANIEWSDTAEIAKCRATLAAITSCFREDFFGANAPGPDTTSTGARTSTVLGATEMESASDSPTTPAPATVASLRGEDGGTASGAGTKRARHLREEERADRLSDTLSAGAQPHAGILAGKPLDVVLYTPHLLRLYKAARASIRAASRLAGHLISFEGDLADMDDDAFEAAPLAPLLSLAGVTGVIPSAASVLAAERVALFADLDECRKALIRLRDDTLLTQRTFWLGNHTTACDWETVRQLEYRQRLDEDGAEINPNFVKLETWEDQVKAAIVGCNREKEGLTKDGKALAGPVHPSILAKRIAAANAVSAGRGQPPARPSGGRPFANGQSRINARLGPRGGGNAGGAGVGAGRGRGRGRGGGGAGRGAVRAENAAPAGAAAPPGGGD